MKRGQEVKDLRKKGRNEHRRKESLDPGKRKEERKEGCQGMAESRKKNEG
jgi:hypothetical protein